MTDLDIIIPVSNLVPESLQSRMVTLLYAITNFYGNQSGVNFKIILVEQTLDGKLYYLANIPKKVNIFEPGTDNKLGEFEIHKYAISHPVFNKSWCINVGFRASEAPYIMVADPDMFCREDYFKDLLEWGKDYPWCFAWDSLHYTELYRKHMILNGETPKVMADCRPKIGFSEGGLVLFQRKAFEKMGMANEFVEELGGIDNEMMSRAREICPDQHDYRMFVWHLWHEGSNKSKRPTRKKNVEICVKARQWPRKMINILKRVEKESYGSLLEYPYCKDHKFDEEWDKL